MDVIHLSMLGFKLFHVSKRGYKLPFSCRLVTYFTYLGQYQIVVHFGYGSTMKYFVYMFVFPLI